MVHQVIQCPIYLDGQHGYDPLLADFVSSWPLLKIGGTLIIDDLGARHSQIGKMIDTLTFDFTFKWKELFRNYQFGIRKLSE